MADQEGLYVLGIDLGTTSVKVSLLGKKCGSLIASVTKASEADIPSDVEGGSEQSPAKILATLQDCVAEIPESQRQKVSCIGVTGQMHGVVMWKKLDNGGWHIPSTSHLYTWQDQRCTAGFLKSLPIPDSHLPLSTGHGCATMWWLQKNRPKVITTFDCSGTIMDLLVAVFCCLKSPVTTVQLAASLGYYNTKTETWNKAVLQKHGFPIEKLPEVKQPGHVAEHLQYDWMGICKGTPVIAALGDVQCAVYSVVTKPTDAVLNISTSSQMMFPVPSNCPIPDKPDMTSPLQYFPYFDGGYLAMAASLNGGNVLSRMVDMLQQWFSSFGFETKGDNLWKKLLEMSADASPGPVITPTLFGERYLPEQRLSISGLTTSNLDLGSIFRSLCSGLIDNLLEMMPGKFLKTHRITDVIATGSVIARNSVIRDEVTKQYGDFCVQFGSSCDSATGAAMFCANEIVL